MAPTRILSRNREWPNGVGAFTLRTAAFIAIASKSAPITLLTTSNGNGETAVARRAIIFSSDQCFSEKCGWVLILQMSARVRPQSRRVRRPESARLLPARRNNKQPRLRPALLRLPEG
jgi:hypothetical protein